MTPPNCAATDDRMMTRPQPRVTMSGTISCVVRKADVRFVATMVFQSSVVTCCQGFAIVMPALLTRILIRPKASRAVTTMALILGSGAFLCPELCRKADLTHFNVVLEFKEFL